MIAKKTESSERDILQFYHKDVLYVKILYFSTRYIMLSISSLLGLFCFISRVRLLLLL